MKTIPSSEAILTINRSNVFAAKPDYDAVQKETISPLRTNTALLMKILADNADTEYGRKYGFSDITSVEEYRKKVPVVTYEDIEPYIQRMVNGEKDILTSYSFSHMNETSGTVGKQKLIPLTDMQKGVFIKYNLRYNQALLADKLGEEWMKGRSFSTTEGTHRTAPSGITIGSASSVMAANIGEMQAVDDIMRRQYTSPVEASIPSPGTQTNYIHVRFAMADRNLTSIICVVYAQLVQLFHYIAENYEILINDIENGTINKSITLPESVRESLLKKIEPMPERAAELREVFKNGSSFAFVPKIWPKLAYFIGIGGDGYSIYDKTIKEKYTGGKVRNLYSGITASEGLWSVPVELDNEDSVLAPGSAFMEFLPVEAGDDLSKCVTIDKLEKGRTYELIITNLCGFYRYRMSDSVLVTGFYNKTPLVRFMYRANRTVDMVGEKTTEKALQLAVESAAEELRFSLSDYVLYPDREASPPRYIFLIQPENEQVKERISLDVLNETIEKYLFKMNEEYCFGVKDGTRMTHSESFWLQPETTFLYRELMIMKGASPSQVKPVHVITNEQQRRFFFGLRDE